MSAHREVVTAADNHTLPPTALNSAMAYSRSRFMPFSEVVAETGLSRCAIRNAILNPDPENPFPIPVQLGQMRSDGKCGRVAFVREEIQAWISNQIENPARRVSWANASSSSQPA